MNVRDLIFDGGRIVISFGVVGTWLYCEVNALTCAASLRMTALAVLVSWLGLEGLNNLAAGIASGKYKKE